MSALNLDIADGEFLVLVGPSGCGKSTALKMIAGLEEVTDGEILIGGEVINDLAARDRDIAMIFQSYALYPHMSVYDNIAFPLHDAVNSALVPLVRFARVLRRDIDAVRNAIDLPWSNGQAEGQATRR